MMLIFLKRKKKYIPKEGQARTKTTEERKSFLIFLDDMVMLISAMRLKYMQLIKNKRAQFLSDSYSIINFNVYNKLDLS